MLRRVRHHAYSAQYYGDERLPQLRQQHLRPVQEPGEAVLRLQDQPRRRRRRRPRHLREDARPDHRPGQGPGQRQGRHLPGADRRGRPDRGPRHAQPHVRAGRAVRQRHL